MSVSDAPFWLDTHDRPPRRELPERCDVAVIGAGICGLRAAVELAQQGAGVVVLEQDRIGSGATGRSLGVLSGIPRSAGWDPSRAEAEQDVLDLVAEAGIECDMQQGLVLLAPGRRGLRELSENLEQRKALHQTRDYAVDADGLDAEAGGNVAQLFAGGIVMPEVRIFDPGKFGRGLGAYAESLGARVFEQCTVRELKQDGATRLVGTDKGTVKANEVLLATGGYTADISNWHWRRVLGVPSAVAVTEEMPPSKVSELFRSGRTLLQNSFRGHCCRPTPDGRRLIMGGPAGEARMDARRDAESLRRYFSRWYPLLSEVQVSHCWHGMIGAARNMRGHVGRQDGIAYGLCGTGLVDSARVGRQAAQLLGGGNAPGSSDAMRPWPLRGFEKLLWRGMSLGTHLMDVARITRQ